MTTTAETDEDPVGTDSTNPGEGSSSSSGVIACETTPLWWNGAWSRRRPISFDTSTVESDQTSFAARIRLDSSRIDYDAAESQGADLRFVADDQRTELDYEVEYWDESGDSEVWLRLPVVPASPAPLQVWMYYGNEGAAAAQNPATVWEPDYVSVHHFSDLQDSTGNGHTGVGANLPSDANGQIGRSFFFDGTDDQVELMNESDYDLTTALTVEAWISVESFNDEWQAVVTKGDNTWRMHRNGFSNFVGFGSDTSDSNDNLSGTTAVNDGSWFYVAIIYDGATKYIYVDGSEDASQSSSGPLNATGDVVLVGNNATHPSRVFQGRIDEVRISSVARSAEWMQLQNRSMRDAGFVTIGGEETCR